MLPSLNTTKFGFRIRTRDGLVVEHLMIHGRDEADAERKLRQMYLHCEILERFVMQPAMMQPTLVPPATMAHVERIAGNLEKMPPKSTYFYPKLLSGLVFNSLKTH